MIYLVRQGQTDWNLTRRFNGCTETELNQTGIDQARQQAEQLQQVVFDICYCSPQKRTRQTAEIISNSQPIYDDRLAEINCGEFEGTEETRESMQLFWQAVMTGDKGTEHFRDFMKRNCDFCEMIAAEHKDKNIMIVTHAANARVINYYFSGKPKDYDFKKGVAKDGEVMVFQNV